MSNPWIELGTRLGPELAEYAARHDEDGSFVQESYDALRDEKVFGALVPTALGGGGAGYRDICELIRVVGHFCGSTSLALSMHTHLVAAAVWRARHGKPGEALLRRVAAEQLVLVSTGAADWLQSNGVLERAEGGYRLRGRKVFASGSPAGALMITSARYDDPDEGPQVLHFPLAFSAEGVQAQNDWDTLGMRGTGSNTIVIDGAFVPDESIAMRRPAGAWHPAFFVIGTAAIPILCSTYVGLAERASELALSRVRGLSADDDRVRLAGVMQTHLFTARTVWNAMVDNAAELDFSPTAERAEVGFAGKSVVVREALATVETAMEVAGGVAFFRGFGLERVLRDAHAGRYHPLQGPAQERFSGQVALGMIGEGAVTAPRAAPAAPTAARPAAG